MTSSIIRILLQDQEGLHAACAKGLGGKPKLLQRTPRWRGDARIVFRRPGCCLSARSSKGVSVARRACGPPWRRGAGGSAADRWRRSADAKRGFDRDVTPDCRAKPQQLAQAEAGFPLPRVWWEEGLENPLEMFRVRCRAGIWNADPDIVAGGKLPYPSHSPSHCDADAELPLAVHCVAAVNAQVEDRVLSWLLSA
jgi:hypothetical protein